MDSFQYAGIERLYWAPKHKRMEFHRDALLEAGYMAQREFVLTNRQIAALVNDLGKMRVELFTDWTNDPAGIPLMRIEHNELTVVTRSTDIEKWEDAMRKLDVPEKE